MPQTNPNRNRNQTGERYQGQHKKSGDQHVLPAEEVTEAPHRPHRVNREDMQKIEPANTGSDESSTP